MSSPVFDDDIVSGTVAFLLAHPDVVAAVDQFMIGGRPTPGVFQHRPWTTMEGSQSSCCVITYDGGWAGPNTYNTLRFPRISVNVWTDPIRDAQANTTDPGVMRRAYAVFRAVDKVLHRTGGPEVRFGTLRVIECVRLTEPVLYAVPDGDGLVRCQATYAITEG